METAVEERSELDSEKLTLEQMATPAVPRRISMIEKYKDEIKVAREALRNALEDDPEYEEAAIEAKAAAQKKKQIEDQIWGSADNQAFLAKIKENQEEITTLEEILNTELMHVYQTRNTDQVTDENGEPRKFKVIAKLLPKSANKDADDFGSDLSNNSQRGEA